MNTNKIDRNEWRSGVALVLKRKFPGGVLDEQERFMMEEMALLLALKTAGEKNRIAGE